MNGETYTLLVLGGDGVGPELTAAALRVLDWFKERGDIACEVSSEPFGVDAYRRFGALLRPEARAGLKAADAVLFGAIGAGDEYAEVPAEKRREWGMIRLRREIEAVANIRPVKAYAELAAIAPLRADITAAADLVLIRELTGGLYVGEPRGTETLEGGERRAFNTQVYTTSQVRRAARIAFDLARTRRGSVTSVDKAIVLETGRLWREEVQKFRDAEHPDIALRHITVDDCAREIIYAPRQFDVLLADNVFGDILTDCASAIAGSVSMMPSASLSDLHGGRRRGLYESLAGSRPDLAGKDAVNPLGAILALAMALEHSLEAAPAARRIEKAVARVLAKGLRAADIAADGEATSGTEAITEAVLAELDALG